jgi:hypothetical protein
MTCTATDDKPARTVDAALRHTDTKSEMIRVDGQFLAPISTTTLATTSRPWPHQIRTDANGREHVGNHRRSPQAIRVARRGANLRTWPIRRRPHRRHHHRSGDVPTGLAMVRTRRTLARSDPLHCRTRRPRAVRHRHRSIRRRPSDRAPPRCALPHPSHSTRQLGSRHRAIRVTAPPRSRALRRSNGLIALSVADPGSADHRC